MKNISVRLEVETYIKFAQICFAYRRKHTEVLRELINQYVYENIELIQYVGSRPKLDPVRFEPHEVAKITPDQILDKICDVLIPDENGNRIGDVLGSVLLEPGGYNYDRYRKLLRNYGINTRNDQNVAIAYKYPILAEKIGLVHYHSLLRRHKFAVTSSVVMRIGDKSRRGVVLDGDKLKEYFLLRRRK